MMGPGSEHARPRPREKVPLLSRGRGRVSGISRLTRGWYSQHATRVSGMAGSRETRSWQLFRSRIVPGPGRSGIASFRHPYRSASGSFCTRLVSVSRRSASGSLCGRYQKCGPLRRVRLTPIWNGWVVSGARLRGDRSGCATRWARVASGARLGRVHSENAGHGAAGRVLGGTRLRGGCPKRGGCASLCRECARVRRAGAARNYPRTAARLGLRHYSLCATTGRVLVIAASHRATHVLARTRPPTKRMTETRNGCHSRNARLGDAFRLSAGARLSYARAHALVSA